MLLLDSGCPELLIGPGEGRTDDPTTCALPVEVVGRRVLPSTHGPVEHLQVLCPRGHRTTSVAPSGARPTGRSS